MSSKPLVPFRPGLSLLELLVVIGLIGVLIGLLLPAVQTARDSATRTACINSMRNIGLAVQGYVAAHEYFPIAVKHPPAGPENLGSWMFAILPYHGQDALYQRGVAATASRPVPEENPPHDLREVVVSTYVCPADTRLLNVQVGPNGSAIGLTSYIGNYGGSHVGAVIGYPGVLGHSTRSPRPGDITDGTHTTLMFGERPPPGDLSAGIWYGRDTFEKKVGPNHRLYIGASRNADYDGCAMHGTGGTHNPGRLDNICDRHHYWSLHRGGANFIMADGSGRFLSYAVSAPMMIGLATRSGGESAVQFD